MGISKSSSLKVPGWSSIDSTSCFREKRTTIIVRAERKEREGSDVVDVTHGKHVLLVSLSVRMLLCITLWLRRLLLLALPLRPRCLCCTRRELRR